MGLFCQSDINDIEIINQPKSKDWKWIICLGEDKIHLSTNQYAKLKGEMCADYENNILNLDDENSLLKETITQLRNELALYKRKQGVGQNKEIVMKIPFELVKDYIRFKED
jgi:hypothetical protein